MPDPDDLTFESFRAPPSSEALKRRVDQWFPVYQADLAIIQRFTERWTAAGPLYDTCVPADIAGIRFLLATSLLSEMSAVDNVRTGREIAPLPEDVLQAAIKPEFEKYRKLSPDDLRRLQFGVVAGFESLLSAQPLFLQSEQANVAIGAAPPMVDWRTIPLSFSTLQYFDDPFVLPEPVALEVAKPELSVGISMTAENLRDYGGVVVSRDEVETWLVGALLLAAPKQPGAARDDGSVGETTLADRYAILRHILPFSTAFQLVRVEGTQLAPVLDNLALLSSTAVLARRPARPLPPPPLPLKRAQKRAGARSEEEIQAEQERRGEFVDFDVIDVDATNRRNTVARRAKSLPNPDGPHRTITKISAHTHRRWMRKSHAVQGGWPIVDTTPDDTDNPMVLAATWFPGKYPSHVSKPHPSKRQRPILKLNVPAHVRANVERLIDSQSTAPDASLADSGPDLPPLPGKPN